MRFWMEMNLVPSIIVLSFLVQGLYLIYAALYWWLHKGDR